MVTLDGYMPDEGAYFGTAYLPAKSCGECGEDATAVWGYIGSRDTFSCPVHDPLTRPGAVAAGLPAGFHYRSLQMPVAMPHTTGHLGVALPA